MRKQIKARLLVAVVLITIFIAGVVTGIAGDRLLLLSEGRVFPREGLDILVENLPRRLDRRLNLTDQQRAEVEAILHRRRDAIEQRWQNVAPAIEDEMRQARQEIESVLDEQQKKKFRNMSPRWESDR